jgi:hypothetical protein
MHLALGNANAHTALSKRVFVTTKLTTVLEHPAYSPDLTPMFFLFPEIKEILKGKNLVTLKTSGGIQRQL